MIFIWYLSHTIQLIFRIYGPFWHIYGVNRQELEGDISLMWKSHKSVSVVDFSSNFINSFVSEDNIQWKFTVYYGFSKL